jgi:hypothetical protein
MIPKDGQLADGSALVEIAGEKYTVAELADQVKSMRLREAEMARREKELSIERSLSARKVLPEFVPVFAKYLADTADLTDPAIFDTFVKKYPNAVACEMLPGSGGGTGGGGVPFAGDKKGQITDAVLDRLASGKLK